MIFRLGELFSGPGGMALGAVKAKVQNGNLYAIEHAWANDFDNSSCDTYAKNICPESPETVICKDVRELDIESLPPINAFAYGFPCNDFSLVGEKKGFDGKFGPLYTYGLKVINHFKPKFFVAENVGGLSSSSGGKALENVGGSPILYQHLFWFLGHPEVYIIILPAMGLVSEVLSVHARKPIFGYRAMVYSILAIAFLSFIVWAHHMFMSGVNPFISNFFVLFTLIIAVPSAVKVFNWIATLYGGNVRFTSAMLFAIGFVSMFISGGLTGIFLGNSAIDIPMHDTYFIVAHFHIVMGIAAFFGMFAGIYNWFPKMYGRFMNETLGKIHFWGTLVGAYAIFWPMHYMGLAGVPRRYYSFETFDAFKGFADTNKFITTAAIVVFSLQVLFVVNFFWSIWKGKKVTDKNPWQSNSLEWTTDIQPGHGNWGDKLPVVHRWAYDYGKDGVEFIPQIEPMKEGESAGDH